MNPFTKLDAMGRHLGALLPDWLLSLASRIALFIVFWSAAQSKITGDAIFGQKYAFWKIADGTLFLYRHRYGLPDGLAQAFVYTTTIIEFFCAILLLIGLLTRLSALGLLLVLLAVQLFLVPHQWAMHLLWACLLCYQLKMGPGGLSVDGLLRRA